MYTMYYILSYVLYDVLYCMLLMFNYIYDRCLNVQLVFLYVYVLIIGFEFWINHDWERNQYLSKTRGLIPVIAYYISITETFISHTITNTL